MYYRDAWSAANHKVGIVSTCWARTRIDYIWVSKNCPWKLDTCYHWDCELSDHKPVILEIDINTPFTENIYWNRT